MISPLLRARLGAAGAAVACALAFGAVYWVGVRTMTGQLVDEAALRGATFGQGTLWRLVAPALAMISQGFVVIGGVMIAGIALVRRRLMLLVEMAIVVGGANLSTQLLKSHVLSRPDLGIGTIHANTLPSGHVTIAASLSAALIMVVARRWRPAAMLAGAAYTAVISVSVLVGQWHRASDVVAAIALVTMWSCAVSAMTGRETLAADRHPGTPGGAIGGRPSASTVLTGRILAAGGAVAAIASVVIAAMTARSFAQGPLEPSDRVLAYVGAVLAVLAASTLGTAMTAWVREHLVLGYERLAAPASPR